MPNSINVPLFNAKWQYNTETKKKECKRTENADFMAMVSCSKVNCLLKKQCNIQYCILHFRYICCCFRVPPVVVRFVTLHGVMKCIGAGGEPRMSPRALEPLLSWSTLSVVARGVVG